MDNNKIKLRNLDEEVLKYFRVSQDKLDFDDLNQEVLDVLNNTNAVHAYNDAGLRSDIAELRETKVDKTEGDSRYILRSDGYTKTQIDAYRANRNKVVDTELAKKLSISDAEANYAKSAPGSITETMLSTELQNKVNARYENKRPEGDASGVSESDFNLLKVSVNTNTTNINKILGSYISKDTAISKSLLDTSVQSILDNARLTTVKITMSDLDSELSAKINSAGSGGGGSISDSISNFANIEKGDTLFATTKTDGSFALDARKVFAREVLLISNTSDLAKAKSYFLTDGKYEYIGDIESVNGDLYFYSSDNTWEKESGRTVYDLIAGRFAYDYSTQNMYFGSTPTSCVEFIRLSDYLSNGDFEYEFTEFDDRLVELEVDFNDLATDYSSHKTGNTAKFNEIDTAINSLTGEITRVDGDLGSYKTSNDTALASTNSKLSTLESNFNNYKTSNNSAVAAVKSTADTASSNVSELQSKMGTVQNTLTTFSTDIYNLRSELDALKAEVEALKKA